MSEEDVVADIDLSTPCKGHTISRGKNKDKWSKKADNARKALIKAKGPPPFPKAVCRHLCENDSMSHNGFVCINPQHIVWGTQQQNVADQCPEDRKERARKAGKATSISMTPEQKTQRGRKGAYASNASPTHPNKLPVICPHCDKVGAKMTMHRWHFDRCPYRSLSDGT